jgi:hypothetical protein
VSLLALVGAVVAIDVAAKLTGGDTITAVLRRNRAEALIGVLWLVVHVCKEDQ